MCVCSFTFVVGKDLNLSPYSIFIHIYSVGSCATQININECDKRKRVWYLFIIHFQPDAW